MENTAEASNTICSISIKHSDDGSPFKFELCIEPKQVKEAASIKPELEGLFHAIKCNIHYVLGLIPRSMFDLYKVPILEVSTEDSLVAVEIKLIAGSLKYKFFVKTVRFINTAGRLADLNSALFFVKENIPLVWGDVTMEDFVGSAKVPLLLGGEYKEQMDILLCQLAERNEEGDSEGETDE